MLNNDHAMYLYLNHALRSIENVFYNPTHRTGDAVTSNCNAIFTHTLKDQIMITSWGNDYIIESHDYSGYPTITLTTRS